MPSTTGTNVTLRVTSIFFVLSIVHILDVVRGIAFIYNRVNRIRCILNLNYFVWLFAFVIANIIRFSPSGILCSGAQATDDQKEKYKSNYLIVRGDILLIYSGAFWIVLVIAFLMFLCIKCHNRN